MTLLYFGHTVNIQELPQTINITNGIYLHHHLDVTVDVILTLHHFYIQQDDLYFFANPRDCKKSIKLTPTDKKYKLTQNVYTPSLAIAFSTIKSIAPVPTE